MTVMRIKRLELGLTLQEVAERSRLTPQLISSVELGRFIPYDVQLAKIATALGVKKAEQKQLLEKVTLDSGV